MLCNGATISRTDYKDLFEAIGVIWGAGDGSTTFKVPDLRDRALYGVGSVLSIGQTDGKGLGNRGGPYHHHGFAGNTDSRGDHSHGVSGSIGASGNHQHTGGFAYQGSLVSGTQGVTFGWGGPADVGSGGAHGHSFSGNTDTRGNHNHSVSGNTDGGYDDKPAFACVQYVITTGRSA